MCERLSNVTILHLQRVRRLAFFYRAYRKQSLDQLTKRLTGELLGLFEEKPKTVVPPRQNTRDPDRCQQDPLRVPYTRPEWLVIIVVYILGNDRVFGCTICWIRVRTEYYLFTCKILVRAHVPG